MGTIILSRCEVSLCDLDLNLDLVTVTFKFKVLSQALSGKLEGVGC